jgi:hypothetical protein
LIELIQILSAHQFLTAVHVPSVFQLFFAVNIDGFAQFGAQWVQCVQTIVRMARS